jgi:hypothetical protein
MKKAIRDYVGTAGHLYWLVTGNIHPKERVPLADDFFFPDVWIHPEENEN